MFTFSCSLRSISCSFLARLAARSRFSFSSSSALVRACNVSSSWPNLKSNVLKYNNYNDKMFVWFSIFSAYQILFMYRYVHLLKRWTCINYEKHRLLISACLVMCTLQRRLAFQRCKNLAFHSSCMYAWILTIDLSIIGSVAYLWNFMSVCHNIQK